MKKLFRDFVFWKSPGKTHFHSGKRTILSTPCLFQKTQKCPFPLYHVCRSIYNFFRYMFWLDFAKMFLLFKYQFPVACCPNSKRQERGSSKTKENTVTRWTRYGCPGSVIVPRSELNAKCGSTRSVHFCLKLSFRTFFVMLPLALSTAIFNKKSHPTWAVECLKLPIVVTLLQWNFCDIPQLVLDGIFCWKLVYLEPRALQKTSPT